ncbi:MAG: lactate utilization protein C [Bacillus sp. (in: Bacteria)]|nr:lactate utilization protein C [Bacillus sp. (in: firmicutes)]
MTKGQILNRESFISNLSNILGREMPKVVVHPELSSKPQLEIYKGFTQAQLAEEFHKNAQVNKAGSSGRIDSLMIEKKDLAKTIAEKLVEHGTGPIIAWNDERFAEWGLNDVLKDAYVWTDELGRENIDKALNASYGICISDLSLAETASYTVIDKLGKGRSSNFLPLNYICIVPQSTIVPRLTQGMQKLHEMSKEGINPAAINFICGSSSSSDIELSKVWGVHGPVRLSYIIVSDL